MIFPSWVLTRFVSGILFSLIAKQSVFRRFKMYHCWGHLNSYVCLIELRNQFQKASCVQKHLLEYVYNLLRLKFSFSFLTKFLFWDFMSKLDHFVWWEIVDMPLCQAQVLLEEECIYNIITSPGFGKNWLVDHAIKSHLGDSIEKWKPHPGDNCLW